MKTIDEETDILKKLYSEETSDVVQPNFKDVEVVANEIDNIVLVAQSIIDNVFSTVNNNIEDIKTNALQANNIATLVEIKEQLISLASDKATLDSLYTDKVTLDAIYALKEKLDSLYADKSKLDSIYVDKSKLDDIYTNLSKINSVINNIADIQNAEDNAQIAITKAQEASDSADVALQAKEDAQLISGGNVLAENIIFPNGDNLNGYKSSIQSQFSSLGSQYLGRYSNAVSATFLKIGRYIGGVIFNGTQNIDLAGVNKKGNQDTSGTAANADKLAGYTLDELKYIFFPVGLICEYEGLIADIPQGFQLMDGTNGTRDMTNLFVYGATTDTEIGTTGGSADAVVVEHGHTGSTNTTGHHTHPRKNGVHAGSDYYDKSTAYGNNGNVNADTSSYGAGDHSHIVEIENTGEDGTNKNLPPYIKLAYIKRVQI